MEHLTIDQIFEFVSMTKLNAEAIKLAATVNGHIRTCDKCLELVRACQLLYDEFSRLNRNNEVFREFLEQNLSAIKQMEPDEVLELDGFR